MSELAINHSMHSSKNLLLNIRSIEPSMQINHLGVMDGPEQTSYENAPVVGKPKIAKKNVKIKNQRNHRALLSVKRMAFLVTVGMILSIS